MLLEAIKKAAVEATKYLREEKRSSKIVGRGIFGDVTKAFDRESEGIIISILRRELGDEILVVSEELGVKKFGEGDPKWVIIMDPVDGSTNYDAGIPWVSVAIAGARYLGRPVTVRDVEAAVVAEVFRDVVYEFSIEGGVKVNGEEARRRSPPAKVLLGYFEVPEAYDVVPKYWRARGGRAALRSLGSAALDVVYVGLGRAEAFIDARAKLRNVDVAAAVKIASALGAVCVTCGGESALNVPIDDLVRVKCLAVSYDRERYRLIAEAMGFPIATDNA